MANKRRRLVGRVVSDKMDKTVVVSIEISKPHRIYKKVVRTTKKIYAHDEGNTVKTGSLVRVVESKPYSKTKRWVVEVVLEDVGNRVLQPIAGEVEQPSVDTVDSADSAESSAEVAE